VCFLSHAYWSVGLDNVSATCYTSIIKKKEGQRMNLEEYKAYVEATRLSNLAIAMDALRKSRAIQATMSVPSDTITTPNKTKDNK
jgi:hypothetical protein